MEAKYPVRVEGLPKGAAVVLDRKLWQLKTVYTTIKAGNILVSLLPREGFEKNNIGLGKSAQGRIVVPGAVKAPAEKRSAVLALDPKLGVYSVPVYAAKA
jgi:hypothetical protein